MNYDEFKIALLSELEKRLAEGERVDVREVRKNNNQVLEGIVIDDGVEEMKPTLYIQHLYESYIDGATVETAAEVIIKASRGYKGRSVFVQDYLSDYEAAAKRLAIKLVNTELNKEFLSTVPHRKMLDLSMVCYVLVFAPNGDAGSVTVNDNLLELWEISEDELFKSAAENTERMLGRVVMPLKEKIEDMVMDPEDIKGTPLDSECPAIIVTNNYKLFGAANMLNTKLMDECAEAFGGDFIIIPSSVHEILLTSMDLYSNRKELDKTIIEVNSLDDPVNNLSDHSYIYSAAQHKVMM